MTSLLSRYRSGEREQVWKELQAQGTSLESEARDVAQETMKRARQNCEELIRRLKVWGYQFKKGPYPTFRKSGPKDFHAIEKLESVIGAFPLSIRSWYEEVGALSLMGSHPEWEKLELHCDAIYRNAWKVWKKSGGSPPQSKDFYFLYTDPLVIGPAEDFVTEYEEWKQNLDEAEENEKPEPLRLSLSPDFNHKADVSGGPAYSIRIPNGRADGLVESESHHLLFVPYLRFCFTYGGFPGFSSLPDPMPASLKNLSKDLLPI